MPDSELAELGRAIVADGRLRRMRQRLGLSRSIMAEMLYVASYTYAQWEDRPDEVRPWGAMAERVARFYNLAQEELRLLEEVGIDLTGMVPFHLAATKLGLPQDLLLKRYRENKFTATDAGILGLWVSKDDLR